MSFSCKEAIRKRKSVRTFDGKGLRPEDRMMLEAHLEEAECPFEGKVTFRLLDAGEYGLSSPVILGAETYLAAKAERSGRFELSFGCRFEEACLYAASLGLGTVMLAASLSRAAFERAMDVKENEVLPAASPVGYPARSRSIRESLMRKGLKADERLPFEELFFEETFAAGLRRGRAGDAAEALDMLRLAPSAANRQPWRALVSGNTVHFYEKRSIKESPLGDIQKVDMGIALAHFDLAMKEDGREGRFFFSDPGISCPETLLYTASYERN